MKPFGTIVMAFLLWPCSKAVACDPYVQINIPLDCLDNRHMQALSIPRSVAVQFFRSEVKSLGSVYLTAGDWTVYGQMSWNVIGGNPNTTVLKSAISLSSTTVPAHDTVSNPNDQGEVTTVAFGQALDDVLADDISSTLISFPALTVPTTLYFVASPVLAGGVIGAYGSMTAVRRNK